MERKKSFWFWLSIRRSELIKNRQRLISIQTSQRQITDEYTRSQIYMHSLIYMLKILLHYFGINYKPYDW